MELDVFVAWQRTAMSPNTRYAILLSFIYISRELKSPFIYISRTETTTKQKLVRALCKSRQTPLLMVQSNMELGEWCGLCKIDETGKAKKVVKCSCAVITDFGEESTALEVVMKYIKEQN